MDKLDSSPDRAGVLADSRRIVHAMRFWLPGLLLVTAAAAVFIDLAGDVWLREGFAWDAPLMLAVHSFAVSWLDVAMIGMTHLGTYGVGLAALGVSLGLWRRRDKWTLYALWLSVGGAIIVNLALKLIFARPRPSVFPPLTVETSYSFPSGHTMAATALYGFLALLLWRQRRWLYGMLVALLIPLVAFSRVYLGVHYPSDVLGALAVGILWLAFVWIVLVRFRQDVDSVQHR